MNLEISKTSDIFVADQTPTPTRLIKNCEEFGVFDDLNPFDKSFEAAATTQKNTFTSEPEDSLHTPQVFPPPISAAEEQQQHLQEPQHQHCSSLPTSAPPLDILPELTPSEFRQIVPTTPPPGIATTTAVQKFTKYRKIAEKPTAPSITISAAVPPTIEILQPVIELQCNALSLPLHAQAHHQQQQQQLLKDEYCITSTSSSSQTQTHERSSASLTPTSQLPIKERLKLKAILSSKTRKDATELRTSFDKYGVNSLSSKTKTTSTADCLDRRRAAAARYRNKIKYEFKELKKENSELRSENANLRERVQHLEKELAKLNSSSISQSSNNGINGAATVPIQLRIPPVHLVMNIPQLLITPTTQSSIQHYGTNT